MCAVVKYLPRFFFLSTSVRSLYLSTSFPPPRASRSSSWGNWFNKTAAIGSGNTSSTQRQPSTAEKMHTKLMLCGCSFLFVIIFVLFFFFQFLLLLPLCAQHANMLITVIRTLIRNDIYPVFGFFSCPHLAPSLVSNLPNCTYFSILQICFCGFNTKRTDKIYSFFSFNLRIK